MCVNSYIFTKIMLLQSVCTRSGIYKDRYSEVFIFMGLECLCVHLCKDASLSVDIDILCLTK